MAPHPETVKAMNKFFITHETLPGQSAIIAECCRCRKKIRSTHTRRRAHIIGRRGQGIEICNLVYESEKTAYLELEERFGDTEAESSRASGKRKCDNSGAAEGDLQRQAAQPRGPLPALLAKATKATCDQKVALFMYANGIPFTAVRCPHFKEMCRTIAATGSAYSGPAYNGVRTYLLDDARNTVDKNLKIWRNEGHKTGFVMSSDGWTDTRNRPLMNIILSTPKGPHFFKAIDCSGQEKNAAFTARLWIDAIKEVGEEHISVLISDSAAVNKAAGDILMAE